MREARVRLLLLAALGCVGTGVAQWETDLRLTYSAGVSWTSYTSARCLAAAQDSLLHAVWFDDRDGNYEIYYKHSTDQGSNWSADVRLTDQVADSYHPAVAATGTAAHVVWWDERNGLNSEIYYKRSTDAGLTWTGDIRLTTDSAKSHYPSVAVDESNVHLVWWDERNGWEIYYKRSSDGGETWSQDTRLTNDAGLSLWPCVAARGGFVHVVWFDNRDGNEEIYYKRSADRGQTWADDVRLTSNYRFSEYPTVVCQDSDIHVVWSDDRDGNWEIYHKRSTDAGATWSDDSRLTTASYSSQLPSVAARGQHVALTWSDNRDGYWAEVYYKESRDQGQTWSADLRLTNDPSPTDRATCCILGSGVHVLWEDARDAADWEIYYKRNLTGLWLHERPARTGITGAPQLLSVTNPARGRARLDYELSVAGSVRLELWDRSGRLASTLAQGRQAAGRHEVVWDLGDLAAGIYFFNLLVDDAALLARPLQIAR